MRNSARIIELQNQILELEKAFDEKKVAETALLDKMTELSNLKGKKLDEVYAIENSEENVLLVNKISHFEEIEAQYQALDKIIDPLQKELRLEAEKIIETQDELNKLIDEQNKSFRKDNTNNCNTGYGFGFLFTGAGAGIADSVLASAMSAQGFSTLPIIGVCTTVSAAIIAPFVGWIVYKAMPQESHSNPNPRSI